MNDQPSDSKVCGATNRLGLKDNILRHIVTTFGSDCERLNKDRLYKGLAYAVRDRLAENWVATRRLYRQEKVKRVYYLSLEFLPGRFLKQNIQATGLEAEVSDVLNELAFTLGRLEKQEAEPGLGNGGLGRLASCFMDSIATLRIPGHGYGIRYDYGLFEQGLEDGNQTERADNWMRFGSMWQFDRPHFFYLVRFGGRVERFVDDSGRLRHTWVQTKKVRAMACDFLVPGFGNHYTTNMRMWAAKATTGFNLKLFNSSDYVGALREKATTENISMVLYPEDETVEGKELRLKQQYFLVSATLQDIMRRHDNECTSLESLPDEVAVHLNETHPAIAVAELMRLLVDERLMEWETAWNICTKVFSYTNHTVLPEALECWPVDLIERVLPRHMEIIYEINRRFLEEVSRRYPGNLKKLERLSLISEGWNRLVRMAHLAIVGSHKVNGVAALHTGILKNHVFPDFYELWPEKFLNVTNGISPRRFLLQANPSLAALITEAIGPAWVRNLEELAKLRDLADDPAFQEKWQAVRQANKERLIQGEGCLCQINASPEALFDIQVKRIHEYKRHVLNILHAVTLYNRIKVHGDIPAAPRVILIGGKAAPGYHMAKLIIKLITAVARVINEDPQVRPHVSVHFLPNFNVAMSERLIRAADLSEQISTAGMEASGTGNMKFALNGALTIGTMDGANIEIREEVGPDNFFAFGLSAEEVARNRSGGYNPRLHYEFNDELKHTLDMIHSGFFSPGQPELFRPITTGMLDRGDWFMVLADYEAYVAKQAEAMALFRDQTARTRRSILNTAGMGKFSSDRAVMEYVRNIWKVNPLK
ncbi:glycogen/starch/alpha-glucan phosphorylase [Solidesulfovibrio sp.]